MKRHERPYGCTFLTCNKKFGSKNDWKRHENSQHFHLETWRCDAEKLEGGVCAKVCYRRQSFQDHLIRDHAISDPDIRKTKVELCRIGRNCQARFWCGFCTKLIDLAKHGIDAWTERFDHIDDHFMGRYGFPKQGIQDWIPVDSDKPKGDVQSQSPLDLSPGSPSSPQSVSSGRVSLREISPNASPERYEHRSESPNNDTRPPRRVRTASRSDTLIYCCQCNIAHNPKFDETCTVCEMPHEFCNTCVKETTRRGGKSLYSEAAVPNVPNFQESHSNRGDLKPREVELVKEAPEFSPGQKDSVVNKGKHVDAQKGALVKADADGALISEAKKINTGDDTTKTTSPGQKGDLVDERKDASATLIIEAKKTTNAEEAIKNASIPGETLPSKVDQPPESNEQEERSIGLISSPNMKEQEAPTALELSLLKQDATDAGDNRLAAPSIMWPAYDMCSMLLAKCLASTKQDPDKNNLPSARKLRASLESLFLWGESFEPSDLDYVTEWSYDLREAIMQFLVDIALGIFQGLLPRLSDSDDRPMKDQIAKLSKLITKGTDMNLVEIATALRTENMEAEDEDDDEQDSENDDEEEEADGFVTDIHISVQCMMDLIPSMEQVLQQQSSTKDSSFLEEERGRRL